ncbi:hypothetical protein KEJ21_06995 [Candidatus Bathyarchaeota archaeon]|nr:hypothetical protein [Candidatus Bathyarchaeota archaeon]MBS7631256.1 hypothetical protein [Candidatus Bathyarchaeota archaeon]
MSQRVSSGNSELDKLNGGGFIPGSLILLTGGPGVGKTILSARFIYEGATKYGDPGVYACFAETKKTFIRNMQNFDVNFETLTLKKCSNS